MEKRWILRCYWCWKSLQKDHHRRFMHDWNDVQIKAHLKLLQDQCLPTYHVCHPISKAQSNRAQCSEHPSRFSSTHIQGFLPALSIDGACTEAKFTNFIKGVLLEMSPFPGKNSILVMDNAVIHKSPGFGRWSKRSISLVFIHSNLMVWLILKTFCRGVHLEYLPPYSPDFNPIE